MVVSGPPRRHRVSEGERPAATKDSPPVIVKYTNGLLVNGAFYDYTLPGGMELLHMLQNREFDRDVLNMSDSHACVLVEEQNETYPSGRWDAGCDEDGRSALGGALGPSSRGVRERMLPEEVDLTGGLAPHARFKICINGNVTMFKAAEHLHVEDVVGYIKSATGLQMVLFKHGRALGGSESVTGLDRYLIEAMTAGDGAGTSLVPSNCFDAASSGSL